MKEVKIPKIELNHWVIPAVQRTIKMDETVADKRHIAFERWEAIEQIWGVSSYRIRSESREGVLPEARHVARYSYFTETKFSLAKISELTSHRSSAKEHSNVIRSIEYVRDRMDTDEEFKIKVEKLMNR